MVRNSTKLDRRTKQHTQFGVPTSDGSRDMARTKTWRKKKKKKKKRKKNERFQNHIASPTGIANEQDVMFNKGIGITLGDENHEKEVKEDLASLSFFSC